MWTHVHPGDYVIDMVCWLVHKDVSDKMKLLVIEIKIYILILKIQEFQWFLLCVKTRSLQKMPIQAPMLPNNHGLSIV